MVLKNGDTAQENGTARRTIDLSVLSRAGKHKSRHTRSAVNKYDV